MPELNKAGIDAEIIYAHTIKPFDYNLVAKSIKKTGKYLVIEEHTQYGGVGDEVMRAVQGIENVKSAFISIPDCFIHGYGHYKEHCEALCFTCINLVNEIKKLYDN